MDESCGHYANCNKSDRERDVCSHLYLWNLKRPTHRKREKIGSYHRWGGCGGNV